MAKLLDFLLAAREDCRDDVERLCKPDSFSSREEMNNHFNDCIGYIPDQYFNEREVESYFNDALRRAPLSVQEQMIKKKNDIISKTLETIVNVNDAVICSIFCSVCKSIVGWDAAEDCEKLDRIIDMEIFNADEYEDDEDNDEDDDELIFIDDGEDSDDDYEDDE